MLLTRYFRSTLLLLDINTWITSRAGRRSSGTIVLSRERMERSRKIPPRHFKKRTNAIERVLKNIGTICKGREWNFFKRTFQIRNAFLLSRTHFKSGTYLKSGTSILKERKMSRSSLVPESDALKCVYFIILLRGFHPLQYNK